MTLRDTRSCQERANAKDAPNKVQSWRSFSQLYDGTVPDEKVLRLPRSFTDAIVAQARTEHPNEACGILAGADDVATQIYPMANAERSPVLYRMDPAEQFRVFKEIEDAGLERVAIYHSHTRSAAYPSATDVRQAFYPECIYLIVSLADVDAPDLRGFRIEDGKITPVELELTE